MSMAWGWWAPATGMTGHLGRRVSRADGPWRLHPGVVGGRTGVVRCGAPPGEFVCHAGAAQPRHHPGLFGGWGLPPMFRGLVRAARRTVGSADALRVRLMFDSGWRR